MAASRKTEGGNENMDKYENHYDEWREEENRIRYEREQARRQRWIDPRDPDYIAPEGYCQTCKDYTTLINSYGECKVCETEVQKYAE
jgi:hypothetical protein